MKVFIKLDRLSAWTLLVVIIAYGITGYGMTKGLISIDIARTLHFSILGIFGLLAFVFHTFWAIHLALKRNQIWNIFSKLALVSFYVSLVLFFLWVHFFYQAGASNYSTPIVVNNKISTATTPAKTTSKVASKTTPAVNKNNISTLVPVVDSSVFTATTLAAYDGLNGQPAYVAVDGLVYDVSRLFRNGNHQGYSAGQDLSATFHGQHSDSFLSGYKVVGTYK